MCAIVLSAYSYRELNDTMAFRPENEDDEGKEIPPVSNIREDIRHTATSPTSPRYDTELTEETYVRPVYDTRPAQLDYDLDYELGYKESGESSSSSKSTAGSTPASKKRKASPTEDMPGIPEVSLMSPPPKTHEIIDLRSPHSSRKVSARRQAKYKSLDSHQYFSPSSPDRETELAPPAKIPTSAYKGDRTHMKPFKAQTKATIARLNNEQPTFMWDTGANRSGTTTSPYSGTLHSVTQLLYLVLSVQALHHP
jgi:hypothetical protein